ncbi:endolytic transglycosylase MltG [Commensalibacter oyaizuii]|uniref:Endolytic murein transglycosylase n=1 Tax=Commensalibacter oyaizuii TaxID=3043873 RepID=A0ABT6Q1X0_9PROT|nr:endolytic transglycosylase MltG [Commensalibacter sp. TBRC 16381]MDI2091015.1 endolytic transglycosylase MltG [Commensalibacter sp. TBRC 16381]
MRKLILFIGALFIAFFILFVFGKSIYSRPGPLTEAKNIFIPKGNTDVVLHRLQQDHVIPDDWIYTVVFKGAVALTRQSGALHSAEFAFPRQASIQQVLSILRHAKPVQHGLTIPEGLTAYQIASLINQAPFLTGHIDVPTEGSVLPQTYAYEWGYPRDKLLLRTQEAMKKALHSVWEKRQQIPEIKTPDDLLSLASIVEKETAIPRERPMVARVFINRLKSGMKLQSDPTIIYALTKGKGNLDRSLTRQDWLIADPYNTYWTNALPPTPICSPGIASLEAVAHPVDGNMLYFVANGTGGHSFSASLKEHNHNVMIQKEKK